MEFQTLSLVDYKPICFVYVLELANKKFYVGSTYDINERLERHMNNRGSEWTKLHKPIGLAELLIGGPEVEKNKTIELMAFHGYENVRGASWCQRDLKYPPKEIQMLQNSKANNPTSQRSNKPYHLIKLEQFRNKGFKRIIYILELQDGKYYVGMTTIKHEKLSRHFTGSGSPWTKKYRPIRIIKCAVLDDDTNPEAALKKVTIDAMKTYGWSNVRGHSYSQLELKNPPKELR